MVVVDTDVLLLEFSFHNDARQHINHQFLASTQNLQTTIYNLMELLGQLSFNVAPARLNNWEYWLVEAYRLSVIWSTNPENLNTSFAFNEEIYERPFERMKAYRMSFQDSLIINLAERTPNIETFVTWNARHFQGKTTLEVFTPETYLAQTA